MWGKADDRDTALAQAVAFTGNHALYGHWMLKVTQDWRFSCEHNLSNETQNRRAWIGHAACAYAKRLPEDVVRQAWSLLSDDQRRLANAAADHAIAEWELSHAEAVSPANGLRSRARPSELDFRYIQQDLPLVLCGQGLDCYASHGGCRRQRTGQEDRLPDR